MSANYNNNNKTPKASQPTAGAAESPLAAGAASQGRDRDRRGHADSANAASAGARSPEIVVSSPTDHEHKQRALSFSLKNPKHSLKFLASEINGSNNNVSGGGNSHENTHRAHPDTQHNEPKNSTGSADPASPHCSPAPSVRLAKVASRTMSVSSSKNSVDSDSESDSDDVWLPLDRESTRSVTGSNANNSDGESIEDADENDPKYIVGNINFYDLQEYIDEEREENQRLWLKNKNRNACDNEDHPANAITRKPSNKQKYQMHDQVILDSSANYGHKKKHKLSKAALKYIPKWAQIHSDFKVHSNSQKANKKLLKKNPIRRSPNKKQPAVGDSSSEDEEDDHSPKVVGFAEKMNRVENDDDKHEQDETEAKYRPSKNVQSAINKQGKQSTYTSHYTDIELQDIPNRFSLFTSKKEETVHAPDLPGLIKPGELISDLFRASPWKTSKDNLDSMDCGSVATSSTALSAKEFVWWLDCNCANDSEIKILAKTFGIHPLTTEDIRVSENREKVEFFKNYYFVSFHSFDGNTESEEYLEPVHFYMVVFANGFLSFHNDPTVNHSVNVRRRIRQLGDYVSLSSDWICYALIDDITDSFLPVIEAVDYETDALESSVFDSIVSDFRVMLKRIGKTRNEVMKLVRLLGSKADVIRMLYKRSYNDYLTMFSSAPSSIPAITNLDIANGGFPGGNQIMTYTPQVNPNPRSYTNMTSAANSTAGSSTVNNYNNSTGGLFNIAATEESLASNNNSNSNFGTNNIPFSHQQHAPPQQSLPEQQQQQVPAAAVAATAAAVASAASRHAEKNQIPRADIALYLGDIQDHIITMNQNLVSYEKILARVYTNYLAQLQVESVNSNNKVNEMLSRVTLIGTVIVPLNVITGLFGMNVKVPGEGVENLAWFFGVVGMLFLTAFVCILYAKYWLADNEDDSNSDNEDSNTITNNDGASFLSRFRRTVTHWGTRQNTNNLSNDANRSMVSFSNYV